jgi:NADPH2 dehydrogenase
MCMYSCDDRDGKVTDWHLVHYATRAVGQAGLIIVEATAVSQEGRISEQDLGIWNDEHLDGLKRIVSQIHKNGGTAGIQIAHAGRKAVVNEPIIAPSGIPFNRNWEMPREMTEADIHRTIGAFREGAARAKAAGFDIIEIHAAHGYLINQFLSPLTNKRTDEYGGNEEKRYRFLHLVIDSVREVWSGPLFVRISANEYIESGNTPETYVTYAKWMKGQGVDLIDCSSGGVLPVPIPSFPGYQVPYAEKIRHKAEISTAAVGLIMKGEQAEEILRNNRADLILFGRQLLYHPYLPLNIAAEFHVDIPIPKQYYRDVIGGRVRRF